MADLEQVNANPQAKETGTCALLALPAELRNLIWHFVVVDSEPAIIQPDQFVTPTLAATNRQIREEILPILFNINKFYIFFHHHNFGAVLRKIRLWQEYYKPEPADSTARNNIEGVHSIGEGSRANFARWAHLTHEGKFPVLWEGGVTYDDGELVSPAVTLLREIGTDFKDCSKEVIDEMLEAFWEDEEVMGRRWW